MNKLPNAPDDRANCPYHVGQLVRFSTPIWNGTQGILFALRYPHMVTRAYFDYYKNTWLFDVEPFDHGTDESRLRRRATGFEGIHPLDLEIANTPHGEP